MESRVSSVEPKIFGIGLSRTGTTSLHAALQILGYRSVHWAQAGSARIASLEECYFFDAITDINAAFMFEALYYIFPNAKFIYTTRPLPSWAESMKKHYRMSSPAELERYLRVQPVAEPGAIPTHPKHTALFQAMHHGLYTAHPTWEAAYSAHDKRVRGFFADKPEKLLSFDIFEAGHGWDRLCPFLNKGIPNAPYPAETWKRSEGQRIDQPPV